MDSAFSDPIIRRVIATIHELRHDEPTYLVGGFVRDALIGRESHDLDILVPPPAVPLARELANRLSAAFYPLDESRDVGRVVIRTSDGYLWVDVARWRGSLDEDLRARDFTVNAIAMDITRWPYIETVDLLGGGSDIQSKVLRVASPESFRSDPARTLRLVRFMASLQFSAEKRTWELAKEAVPLLPLVSTERVRDELVKMAESQDFSQSILRMDALGLLPYTFPEVLDLKGIQQSPPHMKNVFEHTLAVVDWTEKIIACIHGNCPNGTEADREMARFLLEYREEFSSRLAQMPVAGRSRKALLKLAALAHDWGKPKTISVGEDGRIHFFQHDLLGAEIVASRLRKLAFAQKEVRWVGNLVKLHMRISSLHRSPKITNRAIFRLIRDAEDSLPDLVLLSLADHRGTYCENLILDRWVSRLALARRILDFYLEGLKGALPKPLLSGRDLIEIWGLPPGREIGCILQDLVEAQAVGEVKTRDDAVEWANKRIGKQT